MNDFVQTNSNGIEEYTGVLVDDDRTLSIRYHRWPPHKSIEINVDGIDPSSAFIVACATIDQMLW